MKKNLVSVLLLLVLLIGCRSKENSYFEKELTFPESVTPEQKIKLSAYLIPTPQQYAWQELELTAFIHFGMNTFTGREWGDGSEDPQIFNPTEFNAEQWVTSLKQAGFNMLILTAKHHDGFCLWQTETTNHSVKYSPWQEGNGDIVREVKDACDAQGMKFGVYLSPWDRNAKSYGNSPKYNEMFVEQLKELLTNYGEVHEVWFDGACGEGPNGKVQKYDWKRFYHVIDSLQPKAVKAIMGNDVRWVGNESGLGRETEWSVTPLNPDINEEIINENKRLNISPTSKDLGSRDLIAQAKTLYWYPSEVDVSIRPGWFYHPEQDLQVKTLQQLVDIYFQSVGMNSVLLLNIPPDTRGLLHEIDVERIKELGEYISTTFNNEKVHGGEMSWRANTGESKEFYVTPGDTINTILLQEDILKGQRVEQFKVEGFINNEWILLTEGTTIGYKRLLKFENVAPSRIRVTITDTRAPANIKKIGAYYAAPIKQTYISIKISDISQDKWTVVQDNPLIVDLGERINIKGFTYMPVEGKESVFNYAFSVSTNGKSWKNVIEGEFSNIKNNPITQSVSLDKSTSARFIQFETISGADGGKPSIDVEQLGILTK